MSKVSRSSRYQAKMAIVRSFFMYYKGIQGYRIAYNMWIKPLFDNIIPPIFLGYFEHLRCQEICSFAMGLLIIDIFTLKDRNSSFFVSEINNRLHPVLNCTPKQLSIENKNYFFV